YLPGLGWAEEGRAWLVVSLGAELGLVTVGGADYAAADVRSSTTYDGREPAATYDERAANGVYSAQLAFDVPRERGAEDELEVRLEYALELAAGDPPAGGGPDRLQYRRPVVVPPATPATD